jgi:peroxiredoxin
MLKLKKLKMPMPVNLNDCILLMQMGYSVIINDGRVTAVVKESKKKRLESRQ